MLFIDHSLTVNQIWIELNWIEHWFLHHPFNTAAYGLLYSFVLSEFLYINGLEPSTKFNGLPDKSFSSRSVS